MKKPAVILMFLDLESQLGFMATIIFLIEDTFVAFSLASLARVFAAALLHGVR
jgi:hypothetical protein